MKFDPHLPQLPSIGELLEHPRVRGVVGRINGSTIARRAAGFIEELRGSLVERAGRFEVPSIGHIAERLAQRLLGDAESELAVINATGVVVGDARFNPPLSDAALQALTQAATEYHAREFPRAALERELSRLAASERAMAVCSVAAAVALSHAATKAAPCRIEVEPLAGVLNPSIHGYQSIDTLAQRIAAGAELVIADGAGLIGGPPCGIVAGRRRIVEAIAQHDWATSVELDPLRAAALRATLAAYSNADPDQAMFQTPVWQLLSAPPENLQQRAERLAALAAACPGVASAEARQIDSAWAIRNGDELRASSWAVAIRPADGHPESLAGRLAGGEPSIAVKFTSEAAVLDLRAVFPRWDQRIIASLEAAGS